MGAMARQGRDKFVIMAAPQIGDFGLWAEQLIAESTGKENKGIIPVIAPPAENPLVDPHADRAAVRLTFGQRGSPAANRQDSPVLTRKLENVCALGGEMFCWEMATTVAGHLLGIHPFDQPNVAQAKKATADVLAEYKRAGVFPKTPVDWEVGGMSLAGLGAPVATLAEGITEFLSAIQQRDYCAILAYISPDGTWDAALQVLQQTIAARTGTVVTIGYGPRYLHSTGQLHKGGPNRGHFIVLTADDESDMRIPGEQYTFSVLKNAQALGDIQALRASKRHVVHFHAGKDLAIALRMLADSVRAR